MRHVQSNIAWEAGDLYAWNEKFSARRYGDISTCATASRTVSSRTVSRKTSPLVAATSPA